MSEESEPAVSTVRSRLVGVLSDERVAEHLHSRVLRLDGEVVDDLDMPAATGTRIVLAAAEG